MSLNLNSKIVFGSKVIAKKPVKLPAPNTRLTTRDPYQGMSQEVQSLSFVPERLNFPPGSISTFLTVSGGSIPAAYGLARTEHRDQNAVAFLTCFGTSNKSSYLSAHGFSQITMKPIL